MSSSASRTTTLVGSSVGDYEIEELRTDGTHYAIYVGTHRKLERKAEVRVHHLEHCSAVMHERIERMARLISRIRHPNVVELYDYGRLDDGRAYVIREWVEGRLLSESVELHSAVALRNVLSELCAGLAAMHEVGLAHGELSTKSIMLSSEGGGVKIVGPLLDRPPEHFDAASVAGDIHALGSIIRELFGATGGKGDTNVGSTQTLEVIGVIVAKCQMSDPERQYKSVISVAQALDRALGEEAARDDGLAPGTLVGDTYRIVSVIGSGGMGKVYEAVHKRLPKRVAIKVISGEHRADALARFRQEAEIASSIMHPHIVRVFDFNTLSDGRPYMVMELLEGEDLAKVLGQGAVPKERALTIAGQVGSALAAAHEQGIVHRDLKPPNIFLRTVDIGGAKREHATVLDFGISKRQGADSSITRTEAIIGTPRYMAPEQAMGKHEEVGPHSDQFALACIVYEMLSGRRCFGGRDLAEIVHSVCYVDPIGLEEICPDLDEVVAVAVKRAMSKRASERFPSIADFVAALEGRTIEAIVESPANGRAEDGDADAFSATAQTVATVASRPASKSAALPFDSATAPTRDVPRGAPQATHAADAEAATVDAGPPGSSTVAEPESAQELPKTPEDKPSQTTSVDARASGMSMGFLLGALVAVAGLVLVVFVMDFRETNDGHTAEGSQHQQAPTGDAQVPIGIVAFDARMAAPEVTDAGQDLDASVPAPDAGQQDRDANQSSTNKPPKNMLKNRETKLPPEALALLAEAERLLGAGKYGAARKLLGKSQVAARSSRGYAITVMSYCGEHNFGAATDWFARVAKSDKRRVRHYCKSKHSVDLE